MKLKHALLVPLMTLSFSNALALSGKELNAEKKNIDQFLQNLGYEDYVKLMKGNLSANRFISPNDPEKGKTVLTEQIKTYAVFNNARQLAVQLLALINDDSMNKEEVSADLIAFTVNMMKLAPLMPNTDYSPTATEQEAWDKGWTIATEKINNHTDQIAADLINVLLNKEDELKFAANPEAPEYEAKLKEFSTARTKMGHLVKFMYTNSGMGHTAYLGKALAAGLLREDKKNENRKFETALRKKLSAEGLHLENYVGTTLKVADEKNEIHDVEIKNGDFILERSYGEEAWQISFAARPYASFSLNPFDDKKMSQGNLLLGLQYKLLGVPGGNFVHYEKGDGKQSSGMDKLEALAGKIQNDLIKDYYQEALLPVAGEKLENAQSSKILNYGISHAGIGMTKTDPETGISMAWAVDVYPNAGLGGIRIMDILGQFAKDGHYMRFGVSRHDPLKFYNSVTKNQSYAKETNFSSAKNQKPSEKVLWPTLISEADYKTQNALGETDPAAWYEKVMRQSTDAIVSEFLGKGLGFAYGFKNEPGQAYCSQMVVLAGAMSSGIDFQSRHDLWDPIMLKMKASGDAAAKDIDTDLRIIAPAGFMWQSDIVDRSSIQVITYKFLKNELEMAEKMFAKSYKAADQAIAKLIAKGSEADVKIKEYIAHNFTEDDITAMAQDELASYNAIREQFEQRNEHQKKYGDRNDRFGQGFFGSTLNFIERRRENGKQDKPEVKEEAATEKPAAE